MKIEFFQSDLTALSQIKSLWEGLRDHHASLLQEKASRTFAERSKQFHEKAKQWDVQVFLASDEEIGKYIGYSIASVSADNLGEIDSIFILDEYRSQGVGGGLMEKALDWFRQRKVGDIHISVLYLNEKALKFYERYGFQPRSYILSRSIAGIDNGKQERSK